MEARNSAQERIQALVVVSVGTDHHPFDRLVGWADQLAFDDRSVQVLVQRGTAGATTSAESQELIPHRELCELFARATAVITHGGPSTVMDVRTAGRLPIVVPRDPAHGEHVDAHQLRFGEHLKRHGLAVVVHDQDALNAAVESALDDPSHYAVPVEPGALPGVVAFGQVLDSLIGRETVLSFGAGGYEIDGVTP